MLCLLEFYIFTNSQIKITKGERNEHIKELIKK